VSVLFTDVAVEKGMLLIARDAPAYLEGAYRYDLWAVTSVRRGAKSASVKLLRYAEGAIIEATATFPDGKVGDNWQVFDLSRADLAHVWHAHESRP
jgi:hypothetical protein